MSSRLVLMLVLIAACGTRPAPAARGPVAVESATAEPAREPAPPPSSPIDKDPLEEVPAGYTKMLARGVGENAAGSMVMLIDEEQTVMVPVFVGGTEAVSVSLRLSRQKYQRPLTHDLLDQIVEDLGAELVRVQVDKIDGGIFYGTVILYFQDRFYAFDARPSDAVALAVGSDKAIYVATPVLDQAGIRGEQLTQILDQLAEEEAQP